MRLIKIYTLKTELTKFTKTNIYIIKLNIKNNIKVAIICKSHGQFYQTPSDHLYGCGCKKCGKENLQGGYNTTIADRNKVSWLTQDSYVYIIKCHSKEESFYKIGITIQKMNRRFRGKFMPYDFEIIKLIKTNRYYAVFLEKDLHISQSYHKYKPLVKFGGSANECFSELNWEEIDKIIN